MSRQACADARRRHRVLSSPKGEPMAMTHSPAFRRSSRRPRARAGRPVASIFTTATSVRLSAPTILALNSRLSVRVHDHLVRAPTTLAFVITQPSLLRMKPEPTPRGCSSSCWRRCFAGARNVGNGQAGALKNSSMSSSMPSIDHVPPPSMVRPKPRPKVLPPAPPAR